MNLSWIVVQRHMNQIAANGSFVSGGIGTRHEAVSITIFFYRDGRLLSQSHGRVGGR